VCAVYIYVNQLLIFFFKLKDTDYLPVTVYIEDENDNAPEFIGGPYNIVVDELTPQGELNHENNNQTKCLKKVCFFVH